MITREIARVSSAPLHPGFLGQGHMAAAVVDGSHFPQTDPFIILMDDQLNLPGGEPVGGAHPHAGFETVTLILEGNGWHGWKTGSMELMTAGKGIVHTEEIVASTRMRILQLWLVLPPELRWVEPRWQQLELENTPTLKTDTSEIRVYSGSSNGITSPIMNHTPFTLVDFHLEPGAEASQVLPASYNGFIYLVEGELQVGKTNIRASQAAWLERLAVDGDTEIRFQAGAEGARFILYAGEPQKAPIISYGPFIADTEDDIRRLYREYRQGMIPHLNDLPESRKFKFEEKS